jgi:hypothetical protein
MARARNRPSRLTAYGADDGPLGYVRAETEDQPKGAARRLMVGTDNVVILTAARDHYRQDRFRKESSDSIWQNDLFLEYPHSVPTYNSPLRPNAVSSLDT